MAVKYNWDKPEGRELSFDKWYSKVSKALAINPNPDDILHFYDYRKAYEEGEPIPKPGRHMSSKYKSPLHPNRFVSGKEVNRPEMVLFDTLSGKEASMQEVVALNYKREQMLEKHGLWENFKMDLTRQ